MQVVYKIRILFFLIQNEYFMRKLNMLPFLLLKPYFCLKYRYGANSSFFSGYNIRTDRTVF